ncbi:winged helix-turn-helix transcriptional regulator [Paenibacillus athensensis]|uniref:HTH marR-type domain-containing protein n=1 Tax=Paenibacillus athensensis TaxID=1967502 RepID=A0A4Y8PT44_9BACL|nr:MarR family winged helix-turn-helix transcriptional regulator [Paenibacillus athensensis]MCD1261557.1 winged helix-turn-helix transcriptional regulator [Paenibacillus athensensis]
MTRTRLAQELARTFSTLNRLNSHSRSYQGLRYSEFQLLSVAYNLTEPTGGGIRISELSKALQMTPSGATHLVKTLETQQLLERLSGTGDKRVVMVRITSRGQDKVRETEAYFFELFQGLVEHLGQGDGGELLRLLQQTISYFREAK